MNCAERMRGVQIGLVNWCDDLSGVQIGLVNISKGHKFPCIPFINIRSGKKKEPPGTPDEEDGKKGESQEPEISND